MKKKVLCSALLTLATFSFSWGVKNINVLVDRSTVLTFPAPILDADLDSTYYAVSIKGANLLIRPKSANAPTRTLLVRYGRDSASYVADISPSIDAPSHWEWKDLIANKNTSAISGAEQKQATQEDSSPAQKTDTQAEYLFKNLKQQYWHLGVQDGGVVVLVPQIVLHEKETYVKIFIKNDTQTFLKFQTPSFESVSYSWKYWIWRAKSSHPATLTLSPEIEVGPKSHQSFLFAFPTFVTKGGIDVYLREEASEGLRDFKLNIPASVLLQASRK